MNQTKLLVLLTSLVLLINYVNYFKIDTHKVIKKIDFVENRILKEEALAKQYAQKIKDTNSSDEYKTYMYDAKQTNYSQAMGKFQKHITAALKGQCTSKNIQWSHSAKTDLWYERLAISTKLECRPSDFLIFIKKLRDTDKLITIERFKAYRDRRRAIVHFDLNLVAYRLKEERDN